MENNLVSSTAFIIVLVICFIPMLWFLFIGPFMEGILDIIEIIQNKIAAKRTDNFWEEKDE